MQFLAYVAVVLVSLTGILVELDWLTKPKLETSSPVQVAASAIPQRPVPKVDGPAQGPSPTAKPATAADAATTTGSAPRDEQHEANGQRAVTAAVTPAPFPAPVADVKADVPGTAVAPQAPVAALKAATAQPPAPAPQNVAAAPAPAPQPPAHQTQQAAATPQAPEPSKEASKEPAKKEEQAKTQAAAPEQPAAQPVSAKTANACDVQACSGAYTSFRASDCSYQPASGGARRICDKVPGTTQRIAAKPRREWMPREASARDPGARRQSRDAELRDVERVVRRITAESDEADARMDQRMGRMGRSQVIMMDRDDSDW